jgi:hypothetical protein
VRIYCVKQNDVWCQDASDRLIDLWCYGDCFGSENEPRNDVSRECMVCFNAEIRECIMCFNAGIRESIICFNSGIRACNICFNSGWQECTLCLVIAREAQRRSNLQVQISYCLHTVSFSKTISIQYLCIVYTMIIQSMIA